MMNYFQLKLYIKIFQFFLILQIYNIQYFIFIFIFLILKFQNVIIFKSYDYVIKIDIVEL